MRVICSVGHLLRGAACRFLKSHSSVSGLRQTTPVNRRCRLAVVLRRSDFSGVIVTILFAVFFLLFAAWMLLGWMIGESRDIRWMRNWCAGIFVITALVSCLAGGALMARRVTQTACRSSVQEFARLLNERAEQGRMEDVRDAIQHLAEQPDEWSSHSPDILKRVDELTVALEKTARSRVASKAKDK